MNSFNSRDYNDMAVTYFTILAIIIILCLIFILIVYLKGPSSRGSVVGLMPASCDIFGGRPGQALMIWPRSTVPPIPTVIYFTLTTLINHWINLQPFNTQIHQLTTLLNSIKIFLILLFTNLHNPPQQPQSILSISSRQFHQPLPLLTSIFKQ